MSAQIPTSGHCLASRHTATVRSPSSTRLHLLKGLVSSVDDIITQEEEEARRSPLSVLASTFRAMVAAPSPRDALDIFRDEMTRLMERTKASTGDTENEVQLLRGNRNYANEGLVARDVFDLPPVLDDLNQPDPPYAQAYWVSPPFRMSVIGGAFFFFPYLTSFLRTVVDVNENEYEIINGQFGPGVGVLYGTFTALTLEILYQRQCNIQENSTLEASLLAQVTQNILSLFRDDLSVAREASQIVADQVRVIASRSRGAEMLTIMRADPYARILSLVDRFQKSRKEFTLQEEALIECLRGEIPQLMESRAKRLSDEASELPPTHFLVLSLLTGLSLIGFTSATLTIVGDDGKPPLESRLVFAGLTSIFFLFYNFCRDLNNPFGGVYQIKRAGAASYLLQIKYLISRQAFGDEVRFDSGGFRQAYDGPDLACEDECVIECDDEEDEYCDPLAPPTLAAAGSGATVAVDVLDADVLDDVEVICGEDEDECSIDTDEVLLLDDWDDGDEDDEDLDGWDEYYDDYFGDDDDAPPALTAAGSGAAVSVDRGGVGVGALDADVAGDVEVICGEEEECSPDTDEVLLLDDWDDGDEDDEDLDRWDEYYDDYFGDDDDDDVHGNVAGVGGGASGGGPLVGAATGAAEGVNPPPINPPLPPGSDPALLYFMGTSGFGVTANTVAEKAMAGGGGRADVLLGSTEVLRADELLRRRKLAEKRSRFGEDWRREALGEKDVRAREHEKARATKLAERGPGRLQTKEANAKAQSAVSGATLQTLEKVDTSVVEVDMLEQEKIQEEVAAASRADILATEEEEQKEASAAEAEVKKLSEEKACSQEEEARLVAEEEAKKRAEEEAAAAEAEAKRIAEEEARLAAEAEAEAEAKRAAEEAAVAAATERAAKEAEQKRREEEEEAEEERRRQKARAARDAYDSSLSALKDPATGVSFPPKLDDDLYLLGVGVRRKAIINVYSVGAYSSYKARTSLSDSPAGSRNKKESLEQLRTAVRSADRTSFVLEMTFKASAETMAGAIADSVSPRHTGDRSDVDTLKKIILEGVKKVKKGGAATKGTSFRFDCAQDVLSVSVDGEMVGSLISQSLPGAFCDIYLDDKAVSPALRESIYGNCS